MESYGLKYFLSVLGLVFVLEGMPYFLSPGGIKRWLAAVMIMPNRSVRMVGLVFMICGIAILYIALRVLK